MHTDKKDKFVIDVSQKWVGKHCETAALRRVLESYGYTFSEELLLGLGGGIGFIYWYMKGMLCPVIGGRYGKKTSNFCQTICERLGAKTVLSETSSSTKAYNTLKTSLSKKQPAITYVDMAFLPYLVIPEDAHFGGHVIVVFGIDETEGTAKIYDRGREIVTVKLTDLEKARGSKFKPFPPKNRMITVVPSFTTKNLRIGIKAAIKDCCDQMLNPPIKNIGLKGFLKWADLVVKWPKMFNGMQLYGCFMGTFIYIIIGGSGGDAFRSMYADFLREASDILKKPALNDIAMMFRESAKKWTEIAIDALPDYCPTFKQVRQLMIDKNKCFEKGGAASIIKMRDISTGMEELKNNIDSDLEKASEIAKRMRDKILECHEIEEKAIKELKRAIS